MSKILILNDSHDRGKNSRNRLGDMHSDMMLKLDETIELSKKCDFVIHLGDIWDSANVSNTVIDDWLDRIEASGKEWYVLPGNHDMIGANWENSKASALSHAIKRCRNVNLLTTLKGGGSYIKGYPYYYNCEEDFKKDGLKTDKEYDNDVFKIACTHAFITEKEFPFATHIKMKDIDTNYDLILCSHFHTVFDKTVNNTRFLNLGAWGRLSITEARHEPRVAIIDTETKEIEIIKLKSAKKGNQIFDLNKIEEIKKADKDLEKFIKSLESTQFQSTNIKDTVLQICKEKNIDESVKDLILNKL